MKHIKLFEQFTNEQESFKTTGYKTLTNSSSIEVEVNDSGDGVRYRFNDGQTQDTPKEADIEYEISDDETLDGKAYFKVGSDKYYLDEFIKVSESKIDEAKADQIYTIEMENSGSGMSSRPSRYYYQTGTLAELIKAYSYTLEVGKSYEHEKGNKKINMNPRNINDLIKNLNNAVNNSAANGYAGKDYSILPEGQPQKK